MDPKSEYQQTTVTSASPVRLLLMMYDVIINDTQQAIEAIKAGDVELRTKHVTHAMQAVDGLQNSLNMADGGETARFLVRFYEHLRAKLLEAQIKQSPDILQGLIELVQKVGAEWRKVELASREPSQIPAGHPAQFTGTESEMSGTWTA